MSPFSPDLQKLSPYVMAEVTSWRGSITKWIKSSIAHQAQSEDGLFCSAATREYGLMYPRDKGIAQVPFTPLSSARLASEIDPVRPHRSGS
jgi:hypothetical protein